MINNPRLPAVYQNADPSSGFKKDWYNQPEKEMHLHIIGIVDELINKQAYRRDENLRHLKLYNNQNISGLSRFTYSKVSPVKTGRLKMNVVRSVIDTVAAKIAAQKPRVTFLTADGDYPAQQEAKKLQKFMDGLFQELSVYNKMREVFLDSCVFGTGALYVGEEEGEPVLERVFVPEELLVNDNDGIYGDPSQVFYVREMTRGKLMALYPECRNEIKYASTKQDRDIDNLGEASEVLRVIVAYKLPSSKKSKDGKVVICIDNATLSVKDYNRNYFPFIVYRWASNRLGFYGRGLCEELMEIQIEINRVLKNIQEANELVVKPKVFIEQGSMVDTNSINHLIGAIIKYSGTKPEFYTPSAIPPDYYQFLGQLIERAYQISGISMLQATQAKPSGLNSAIALREYKDTTSERFQLQVQRFEECFVELARQLIVVLDEITEASDEESEKDLKIKSGERKAFEELSWKKIRMDEDEYVLRRYPTGIMPTEPAAKLQTIMEWFSTNFITKEEAMLYLDFPDTDELSSLVNAPYEVVKMRVHMILDKGQVVPPDDYLNLELAIRYGNLALHRAMVDGVKESRLDLLREWIDECAAKAKPPTPPQPPQPPAGAMPPPGMPAEGMPPPDMPMPPQQLPQQ